MSPDQQKRHFTRVPFDADVRLSDAKGNSWQSKMLDVSLKGALIAMPQDWHGEREDEFQLELLLAGDDVRIDMDVTVAHVEADRVGFFCQHIDIDSISHLHRLIELNLGDEQLLEREMAEMLQLTG